MSFKTSSPIFFPDTITTISFAYFFCINRNTCLCVSFLSVKENATTVLLCSVGSNNFPRQPAGRMVVSFNSTPIYTSRSERNLFLWKRPAAWTEGRHVAAKQQSDQLIRMCSTEHSPGCEDNSLMPWRTSNTWKCVPEYTK